MSAMNRPIPGQSLTDEPKNYAWERPPEITDPNEAVKYHLERVADPEVIDNVFYALDMGMPVKTLTDSMMTGAYAKGIHNIDLGLLVEPLVRRAVMKIADRAKVPYKESFDEEESSVEERASRMVKIVESTPEEERDAGYDFLSEVSSNIKETPSPDLEMSEEPEMSEDTMVEQKPKGLMAR
jgi:hypothetical protein